MFISCLVSHQWDCNFNMWSLFLGDVDRLWWGSLKHMFNHIHGQRFQLRISLSQKGHWCISFWSFSVKENTSHICNDSHLVNLSYWIPSGSIRIQALRLSCVQRVSILMLQTSLNHFEPLPNKNDAFWGLDSWLMTHIQWRQADTSWQMLETAEPGDLEFLSSEVWPCNS